MKLSDIEFNVGKDIRRERKRIGASISAVAREAMITRATLSRIENGHHQPMLRTVQSVYAALSRMERASRKNKKKSKKNR